MSNVEAGLFLDDFEAEAKTHIEKIESAFLEADSMVGDQELINDVFRAAHSLKGTAGFFSLKKIVAVAHALESVFTQIKEGHLAIGEEIVGVVLLSVDCLKELIENLQDDESVDTDQVLETLKKYVHEEKKEDKDSKGNGRSVNIPFDFSDDETKAILQDAARFGNNFYYVDISFNRKLGKLYKRPEVLLEGISSVGTIVEAIVSENGNGEKAVTTEVKERDASLMTAKISEALKAHDTSTLGLLVSSILEHDLFSIALDISEENIHLIDKESISGNEVKTAAEAKEAEEKKRVDRKTSEADGNFSIRLDIGVINSLLDLANEMILTRNQLVSAEGEGRKALPGIVPVIHDLSRLTSEIQEKVMYTRMQPISVIFKKFPRIMYDTAKLLKKSIEVEILRDDVMLDKYLLESLTDPITQLVKNSADHGLESPEGRLNAGKPEKGKITLNAYMHDGSAIIEVKDDGAGIDTYALKRKALERGVRTEEELAEMSKTEVFNMMFEPGVSTAKQVTNLSGRGVGMDIVKNSIVKLGGSIEIESEIGLGTTVRLKMPLTLSVVSSLIVTIDSITYAVPDLNVERIVRIWEDTGEKRLERVNKTLVLRLNGRLLPVVSMGDIRARAKGLPPDDAGDILAGSRRGKVIKCLVLRAGGKSFALLIDDALETEQVLVKPLPLYLQGCACYSNVTVLGTGQAVTILDAEGIMRLMGIDEIRAIEEEGLSEAELNEQDAALEEKQVLVFKCSGTEFYAVGMNDITRIDTVEPGSIQQIGGGRFVNAHGTTIRVVRPEDFAPVLKRSYGEEKLFMLTLKNCATPIGLLVKNVLDKIEAGFRIEEGQILSEYILGTGVFEEKVLIFLNPDAIKEDVENDRVSKMVVRKGGEA